MKTQGISSLVYPTPSGRCCGRAKVCEFGRREVDRVAANLERGKKTVSLPRRANSYMLYIQQGPLVINRCMRPGTRTTILGCLKSLRIAIMLPHTHTKWAKPSCPSITRCKFQPYHILWFRGQGRVGRGEPFTGSSQAPFARRAPLFTLEACISTANASATSFWPYCH